MFNKYKKLKLERDELLFKNAKLLVEINKYNKADKLLSKVLEEKLDLSELDFSTKGQIDQAKSQAIAALNNPVLKHILNNGRYNEIMAIAKDSRDYLEVVQKRSVLLFIENSILKKLRDISVMSSAKPKNKDNDDFAFLNK